MQSSKEMYSPTVKGESPLFKTSLADMVKPTLYVKPISFSSSIVATIFPAVSGVIESPLSKLKLVPTNDWISEKISLVIICILSPTSPCV